MFVLIKKSFYTLLLHTNYFTDPILYDKTRDVMEFEKLIKSDPAALYSWY